jgi:PAS domain S-box-containing protein
VTGHSDQETGRNGHQTDFLRRQTDAGKTELKSQYPCRVLLEQTDWSQTLLGPVESWPAVLRAALDLALPAQAQIVIFWGPQFVALYNDAYSVTIGNKHPKAFGQPAQENWSELWEDLEPLLSDVLRTGQTFSAQNRPFCIERRGFPETVYFDLSYSALGADESGALGVLCIVSETTQRVIAQQQLSDINERLELLFSQTDAGIALSSAQGHLLKVNPRLCEIIGYSEAELLDRSLIDLTFAGDRPQIALSLRRLFTDSESFVHHLTILSSDGHFVPVSCSVSALRDESGLISQAVWTILDVTQQQRAQALESQLAAIVASSHDAILSTDLDMVILSWNEGAERLYGYSAEEAVGRKVTMLLPADRIGEESDIIEKISRGIRVAPHETVRLTKNGQPIDVQLTVSPVRNGQGEIIGASKTAHDIGERKRAERLQLAILGEMKHRIKNVLATVQALARQTFRSEAHNAAYDAFEARLGAMARTHDLLTTDGWQSADLARIVEQTLKPFGLENFSIEGPDLVVSSRAAMAFALGLHELATNAVKYGALSGAAGHIVISWTLKCNQPETFAFTWRENDGPAVAPPNKKGFGTRLIEAVLAAEVSGQVKLTYAPEGCVCQLIAPLSGILPADE